VHTIRLILVISGFHKTAVLSSLSSIFYGYGLIYAPMCPMEKGSSSCCVVCNCYWVFDIVMITKRNNNVQQDAAIQCYVPAVPRMSFNVEWNILVLCITPLFKFSLNKSNSTYQSLIDYSTTLRITQIQSVIFSCDQHANIRCSRTNYSFNIQNSNFRPFLLLWSPLTPYFVQNKKENVK
jgi:hypothetical protein